MTSQQETLIQPDTLMMQLREKTRIRHVQLEEAFSVSERLKSIPSYSSLLEKFYGIYYPLELKIQSVLQSQAQSFDFTPRKKTPLLKSDLEALNRSTDLPLCSNLPALVTFPQILGCLYVLEGSTMGGQVILKQINTQLGPETAQAASFFSSYGKDVMSMWKAFGEFINAYAEAHPEETDTIIQSADDTFLCFQHWLKAN